MGVVHQGQGLALGLEPGNDQGRVHPRLDDLQRHRAPDRYLLLGHEHDAHAPLADLLEQLVRPDPSARPLARRGGAGSSKADSSVSTPTGPRRLACGSSKSPDCS